MLLEIDVHLIPAMSESLYHFYWSCKPLEICYCGVTGGDSKFNGCSRDVSNRIMQLARCTEQNVHAISCAWKHNLKQNIDY